MSTLREVPGGVPLQARQRRGARAEPNVPDGENDQQRSELAQVNHLAGGAERERSLLRQAQDIRRGGERGTSSAGQLVLVSKTGTRRLIREPGMPMLKVCIRRLA
jgi:hypothetical protein